MARWENGQATMHKTARAFLDKHGDHEPLDVLPYPFSVPTPAPKER